MTIQVSSKFRLDLKKVLEIRNSYAQEATKEFFQKKKNEGIELDENILKTNISIILELNRYINAYVSFKNKDFIPSSVKFEQVDANGVNAEWITPPGVETDKVLLYLFGGAYNMGTIETRRKLPFLISEASKIRAFLVGYRLAPEHPFPAALDDAINAYQWLLSSGIKPENIIISGASAGGGLSVATLLKIRGLSLPLPAGATLLSPWTDLALKGESMKLNAEYEPGLSKLNLGMAAMSYSGKNRRRNPLISPLYGDLKGLPPMLVHAGNVETLRDDSVRLVDRAKTAGVDVTLEVWDDMPHVFQRYYGEIPESKQAIEKIGQFIQTLLI